jgi:hypothetical protein
MDSLTWLVIGLIAGWLALIGAAVFVSRARLLTRRTVRA